MALPSRNIGQFPRVYRDHFQKIWKMDKRDQELLDRQLWGVNPSPPRNAGIAGLEFAVVFLVGIAVGSVLFAHERKQIMQIASYDTAAAISFLNVQKAEIAPVSK